MTSTLPTFPAENDLLAPADASLDMLSSLARRRSTKIAQLSEPGPDSAQTAWLLQAASRVPDHGKLAPWRFIVWEGQARAQIGERLAGYLQARNPQTDAQILDLERARFLRAPLVVGVVSCAAPHAKIPLWEQELSAGALCFHLILLARAMGFAGTWLSEWPTYEEAVKPILGLAPAERMAGFIYLGTATQAALERARPDCESLTTYWQPGT